MSQKRITIKPVVATNNDDHNKVLNQALATVEDLAKVGLGCPGCMADRYTLDELEKATEEIEKAQSAALYKHYITSGRVDRATGIVTIEVYDDNCKYYFLVYNAAHDAIYHAIERKDNGDGCSATNNHGTVQ
jgi:hypothetical protein